MTERVIAYIDGFNVYEGIVTQARRDLLWLDYHELIRRFVRSDQTLEAVKYFTAHRRNPPESYARQERYFAAQDAMGTVERIEGRYDSRKAPCNHCGKITKIPYERGSDTNLGTHMVHGAAADLYDVALLVTGDTDQVVPAQLVRDLDKKVKVVQPVGRRAPEALRSVADYVVHVTRGDLIASQLPDPVTSSTGRTIERPFSWLTLDGKQARLNAANQSKLSKVKAALDRCHHSHLHSLADEMWEREGLAVGPHATRSW